MDVLELPRPVINFLRTMAKESCRYVLSWDIFGGTDTVTLTLTWKLTDEEPVACLHQASEQISVRDGDSVVSSRRSRRDNNSSTAASLRASRGKSLEGNNLAPNKQIASPSSSQPQASSLERSSTLNQTRNESDPIYANLCHVRYTTNPLSTSALRKTPIASATHTRLRRADPDYTSPLLRHVQPSLPIVGSFVSRPPRTNHATRPINDENDSIDPWVKRFESLLEDKPSDSTEEYKGELDEPIATYGKVKFKKRPDYF